MKSKIVSAIFAFVVLSSLVVLGSSPELVNNIVETAQNNSIAKVFYFQIRLRSEK